MRVLFNTYPVAFDCPGGGEIQLLESRMALERAGLEVLLYDPWNPQFDDVDLVHYFSVQGGSMNFCSHVKCRGLPLLISPILWLTEQNRSELPLDEIRDLLHLSDLVLTGSEAEAQQFAESFGLDTDRFRVAHNAVDESFREPVPPGLFTDRFGISEPFLLNVANIEPRKNQLRLIQAVKQLSMKLVILGRVRDSSYFDSCRREAGDSLIHLGHLDHGDDLLKSAYRACRAFVLPSLLETPGLAALEAAACRAKVVVTEVGCTREYFGQLVDYVDPLDIESIRLAILRRMEAPDSADLQNHVLDNFTWDRTAGKLISAYESVLADHSSRKHKA